MSHYRQRFLQLALDSNALCFGEFTLKSGRISPYFFNAGHFNSGTKTAALAQCYADAIDAANINFDLVFGPAYKGIPLATALACEYARRERDLLLAFNRKEVKNHGEGGTLIGAPLNGRKILIIDDVITAGTAIREVLRIIRNAGGTPTGIAVALNRQEITSETNRQSSVQALMAETGIPVVAIATLSDLLAFVEENASLAKFYEPLLAYKTHYGTEASD
ncbi:orotate phosphoribosyltransferase [Xylella fastidiosa subsp. pauca]|uniref:orotate phosphoribosyltransferase n=1 Tax=Xylella fastidiosa TaxID=2371 RepID=UPI0005831E1A|nr:orotate phosphoribosyltransferase [Xylella fastidiosa]ARO67789.1 orotate phosphoribosyltransferase [Xylella fastidiosa subsp. pauca]AVI19983.1 orotate phosphoribosyltransferase [Xylella fastidiosa]AVI21978.1 orotate phosphoribosyltransferase [Xylella fastidiosa]KIA58973.1 orotate phosphoribosyltransferase [Xylella fastidiosa]KXB12286.1 orotate phosphoribosyltransferase [Xylella fastidiosa]